LRVPLFLANIFDWLLSNRGLEQLEHRFGEVRGNWLFAPRTQPQPEVGDRILLNPSTMDTVVTPAQAATKASQVVAWVLFPDQVLGWDFARHQFLNVRRDIAVDALRVSSDLYANSQFTRCLLRQAKVHDDAPIIPLGVDLSGIDQASSEAHRGRDDFVHVYWGHMWRTQKDPETAVEILQAVAKACPRVRMTIGREHSWGPPEHSPQEFQTRLLRAISDLRKFAPTRVHVRQTYQDSADYWRFMGSVDISFSCAREETFGLAMMEHAAAGVACVVPDNMCYPEIHSGATLVPGDRKSTVDAIVALVNSPKLRARTQADCLKNAQRYSVDRTIVKICDAFALNKG